jgi:hypothetical protein
VSCKPIGAPFPAALHFLVLSRFTSRQYNHLRVTRNGDRDLSRRGYGVLQCPIHASTLAIIAAGILVVRILAVSNDTGRSEAIRRLVELGLKAKTS